MGNETTYKPTNKDNATLSRQLLEMVISTEDLWLLDLIDTSYIDYSQSIIGKQGVVYLNLDLKTFAELNDIPIESEDISWDITEFLDIHNRTFLHDNHGNKSRIFTPNVNDKYYIKVDISIDKKCTDKGIKGFVIKRDGVYYNKTEDFVQNTFELMQLFTHLDFDKYNKALSDFRNEIESWVKERIRTALFQNNVLGVYNQDTLKEDTYFQQRKLGDKEIHYIINEWWNKLQAGEVEWIDIFNGDETVFVALN